mmetsp:Transcript_74875/g.216450  ORF Transcript_74875/g.216450 Transcript_74875/m.216450 type:complete len:710 (-) Transcript_74875:383-2512(-)
MAYNFASSGYHNFIRAGPNIDTDALRAETVKRIEAFDPRSWYDAPVETLLLGEALRAEGDRVATTTDAFGKENGRQVLAAASSVDRVIEHARSFRIAQVDQRSTVREIEDALFRGPLASELVANQAIDFHKQDGITEIEESVQALLVERQLNDALLADERAGKLTIGRQAAFVGCVSNFTNFLDLCRKILRNIELGVPVVVLSRSNTTQHMYRYFVRLAELMRQRDVDLGLCTYCSCSIAEQRRLLAACPGSPMYFTGSREVASMIKEVAPKLVASTGGPNTMVVGDRSLFSAEVAAAARASNLIEHKGQCTALRHLVLPGATEADIRAMYEDTQRVARVADSIRAKGFAAQLKGLAVPLAEGYSHLKLGGGAEAAVRHCGVHPPKDISEQWREVYLDVTAPPSLDAHFMGELTAWLNREQPISLAMNCNFAMALELFERTALVVYTVGRLSEGAPALTAQARPQDGECFGEFPPRRQLDSITTYPVIIPSSTPGYNSVYARSFLREHGAEPRERWAAPAGAAVWGPVLDTCASAEQRGYCRVLLEYLADAAQGPRRGCGARTALFGLQRPPLRGGVCCLRLENAAALAELAPHLVPFAATTAAEQLVVSAEPQLSVPSIPGIRMVMESHDAFRASEAQYWNVTRLPRERGVAASVPEFPLAAHFVSRLFPMGHVKSTLSDDVPFLEAFSGSPKWLRMAGESMSRRSRM